MRIINMNNPETSLWRDPETLFVFTTQAYASTTIPELRKQFPSLNILGISSSHGLLHPEGFKRGGYGLLLEREDKMPVRLMSVDLSEVSDIRQTIAQRLAGWASDSTNRAQIFIHATPGTEDRIIEGIQDAFHGNVCIFGATAGQDKLLPQGFCFLNETCLTKGVVILQQMHHRVFCAITYGGYLSTSRQGIATASHERILETIDGRPAAEVYDEWTDGMFCSYIKRGGILPPSAALYPFGRTLDSDQEGGFWLSHPYEIIRETKAIRLFAEIPAGSRIQLMRGTTESTITHTATAISQAISQVKGRKVDAAVIMYCAGCASAISSQMNEVCEYAHKAFGDIPFVGCTTFGEQGRLQYSSQNYHGNMMIEIILVLDDPIEE